MRSWHVSNCTAALWPDWPDSMLRIYNRCRNTVGSSSLYLENERATRAFSQGLLSLIYIPLPGGLGRVGVINICNVRINDLSLYDGLETITEMETGQSHIQCITEYYSIIKSPPVVFTAACLNTNKSPNITLIQVESTTQDNNQEKLIQLSCSFQCNLHNSLVPKRYGDYLISKPTENVCWILFCV